jgi:FeS assembly SUF system regulator
MQLNRLTDYAVIVLSYLAREPRTDGGDNMAGDFVLASSAQIAEETAVPSPTVAKLLKMLCRSGLVTSQRGIAGGYFLSRSPLDISVAEIIRAVEGPIALTACVDGNEGDCSSEAFCSMRGNWDQVNRAVTEALERVSLVEMRPMFPEIQGMTRSSQVIN